MASEKSTTETAACPVVSDILQKHLTNPASFKAVKTTEEVTSGFCRAYATLDNGSDLDATIKKKTIKKSWQYQKYNTPTIEEK